MTWKRGDLVQIASEAQWNDLSYRTLAARQAAKSFGDRYAQHVEDHTLKLIAKGHLPASAVDHTLGQRLAGNDGQ